MVVCSDGLERGDPEQLEGEMGRLSRLAHRVVWVNPLKGDPEYQPLARGMQAALPLVSDFLPVHNLDSLQRLAEHLQVLAHKPPQQQAPDRQTTNRQTRDQHTKGISDA